MNVDPWILAFSLVTVAVTIGMGFWSAGKSKTAGEEWEAQAKVLKENVEHHVEEEENELFPKADAALSEEDIEALGERMAAEKERQQGRAATKRSSAKKASGKKSAASKSSNKSASKSQTASRAAKRTGGGTKKASKSRKASGSKKSTKRSRKSTKKSGR